MKKLKSKSGNSKYLFKTNETYRLYQKEGTVL